MKTEYRLVALDIDGTLLTDEHRVLPEVLETVKAVSELGAEIVLCTGRGPNSTLPILEEFNLSGSIIVHNGAVVVDAKSRQVVYEDPMAFAELQKFITYCQQYDVHYDINTPFQMMIEKTTPELDLLYREYKEEPIIYAYGKDDPSQLVKLTAYGPKEQIDQTEMDWEIWKNDQMIVRSGDNFLDVQSSTASKGNALRAYAALKGIDSNHIVAIGNYYNDISMLQYAGASVAMENSPQEVKDVAGFVTVSNNEAGVAKALKRLFGEVLV